VSLGLHSLLPQGTNLIASLLRTEQGVGPGSVVHDDNVHIRPLSSTDAAALAEAPVPELEALSRDSISDLLPGLGLEVT
jgi:hypothetical protein